MLSVIERIDRIKKGTADITAKLSPKRVVVHADLMRAIPFRSDSKMKTLETHIRYFNDTFQCPVWIPAFTYSTSESHVFDIRNTPSEIGMLNEYYRVEHSTWRTSDPIFSYAGNGNKPKQEIPYYFDTYGQQSVFSHLVEPKTFLLQYGCRNGTQKKIIINYIEYLACVPYRIKQSFNTVIIHEDGTISSHQTFYQVHPKCGISDKYRDSLFEELVSEGIVVPLEDSSVLIDFTDINQLVTYLLQKLRMDPLYLLSPQYQEWLKHNHYV